VLPEAAYAVCVHASSRDDKRWPDANWRALIPHLEQGGMRVLLPWGTAAERVRSEALAHSHPNARVPPHQPLPVIAAMLRAATLVVGVDTGLVHLAAALGTPTVALFTVTDPSGAGVAIAGAHACDVGGRGVTPSVASVTSAMGRLLRDAPRC
jgi:heptosyltransferase-1